MNIEKRSDLFREYARIIDMCEGTEIYPSACVKLNGTEIGSDRSPNFDAGSNEYTFAVAILEGKPVFVGDEVYYNDGELLNWKSRVSELIEKQGSFDGIPVSWNKPTKRTFTLAGHKMVIPKTSGSYRTNIGHVTYYFDSQDDKVNFNSGLCVAIMEAIENARLQNK